MIERSLVLNENLSGVAMREELIRIYNELVYWSAEHARCDAEKKRLETIFDIYKDRLKMKRSQEVKDDKLNMKEKEMHINNFWDEEVVFESKCLTMEILKKALDEASMKEVESRHNMNTCSSGVDVARSIISFDKTELSKLGNDV